MEWKKYMKIIADQNIPFVDDAFSSLGEVTTVAGTEITPSVVADADILLVRSVTHVNEQLLAGSKIEFVGTATIGRDHIDEAYLAAAGIGFSSAPGCNANSVAEYVITAMFKICAREGIDITDTTLAIVGVGNIGTALYEKASALGMRILLNDPLRTSDEDLLFEPLEEVLPQADFVSVHVPLTYDGRWATHRMINHRFLSLMKEGGHFINASRGRTIEEHDLIKHASRLGEFILDVWPEEPIVSDRLMDRALVATPHIAGYSYDGKVSGTAMIYRAASHFFQKAEAWQLEEAFEDIAIEPIEYHGSIVDVLTQAYDIDGDDTRFRKLADLWGDDRVGYFSRLRREYPRRYEWKHHTVVGVDNSEVAALLHALGFRL